MMHILEKEIIHNQKTVINYRLIAQIRKARNEMAEIISIDMAKAAYKALDDKQGLNIKVLDISGVSTIADYFVIASGSNENQVKALVDNTEQEMAKLGCEIRQVEGYNTANWILLDYNDIIIHVFNQQDRLFYDLERIWRDGKEIEIESM